MKPICKFANANIIFEDRIEEGDLFVKEGKISPPVALPDKTIDCRGKYLASGLVDLQVNGVAGLDFTQSLAPLAHASKMLAQQGVTGFLAAIVSQPVEQYKKLF